MNIQCLEGEVWKEIPSLKGAFLASNFARIYSTQRQVEYKNKNGTIVKRWTKGGLVSIMLHPSGYLVCTMGHATKMKVHRLVCEAFHGMPNGKQVVNHINGDKADNRPENLEWTSNRDNCMHYFSKKENGLPAGIYFHPTRQRFQGSMMYNGKRHFIGDHKNLEDAITAYRQKELSLGMEASRYF